jgi:hypothetical protein
MTYKYELYKKTINDNSLEEWILVEKYKTFQDISKSKNIPIHLVRKLYMINSNKQKSKRPHFCYREWFDNYSIKSLNGVLK